MKFGVVIFPGSNCDEDIIYALEDLSGKAVTRLWHKDHDLQGVDFLVLPGGFSYGDYLRSGAIARFSPIMKEVVDFAKKGGYVFGICNGFQVLTESHLLPGALLANESHRFICKTLGLKVATTNSLLTKGLSTEKSYQIPIAHAEGRFYANKDTLDRLQDQDQVLFYYDENPNGSERNIAGITNEGRNVFGMMPHPERAADPVLGNTDGVAIFESILQTVS